MERMSDISNETVLVASISDEYTKVTIAGLGNTVIKANGLEEMVQLGFGVKTNPIRKSAFLPFKCMCKTIIQAKYVVSSLHGHEFDLNVMES